MKAENHMSQICIDQNVEVPMRDGTILRADVYRPAESGSYPVLVHRTPYDRTSVLGVALFLDMLPAVNRGYIVVHQDTRGRFDSDGEWLPWAHEQKDGYDTVVWASRLSGSNGKVGLFGGSYSGQTQWAAAIAQPPGLAAIAPQITWSDPADGLLFRGGAVELGLNAVWTLRQALSQLPKVIDDPEKLSAAFSTTLQDLDSLESAGHGAYWELPATPLPALERAGMPDLGVKRALQDPATTDECRVAGRYDQVTVPSLNIAGWFDVFQQGSLDNYIGMRARGVPARLVVGPWQHDNLMYAGQIGDVNFGAMSLQPPGARSTTHYQLDWFDRYLRDDSPTVDPAAPVQIFVMGINQWRDEQEWPLQRAVATPLYLHLDGGLSFDRPSIEHSRTEFVYDPADPVLTRGGNLVMAAKYPIGPVDQAPVESRPDVLVFSTQALTEDLEITGRVTARLFAATDGPTTDWVVKVCDVDENGLSVNFVEGITRVTTEPGRTDEVEIDLWSTSIVIKAGHRLRVLVTSSNFPRWDRNPNTDTDVRDPSDFRVAKQTIHHDAQHLSHIVLPVIPA